MEIFQFYLKRLGPSKDGYRKTTIYIGPSKDDYRKTTIYIGPSKDDYRKKLQNFMPAKLEREIGDLVLNNQALCFEILSRPMLLI
jgi:hypothetical protein